MVYLNQQNKWCRICPKCKCEIISNSKKWDVISSDNKKRNCLSCRKKGKIYLVFDKEPYQKNDKWIKTCPVCCNEIYFRHRNSALESIKKGRTCKMCASLKMFKNDFDVAHDPKNSKWYNKCPSCHIVRFYSSKGNATSNKLRECRSCCRLNKKHWLFGRKINKNVKEKIASSVRESVIQRVKKLGGFPSFNPDACLFMDLLSKKYGWNIRHALNGGEVLMNGYSLDGYDETRKIIVEYDENHHKKPHQKRKDKIREQILIKYVNPTIFLRYDVSTKRLYNVLNNQESFTLQ